MMLDEHGTELMRWDGLLDALARGAEREVRLREAIEPVVGEAREILRQPLVRRVYRYADVGKHRTHLDGRALQLEPEIQETFALAMSDCGASGAMARELPLLSAAYRLTGEEAFRKRLLAQLDEMATWSPIQRPGWTCFKPGNRPPEDGKGDGNWLATGSGVRAIGDVFEITPDGTIPSGLHERLEELLAMEIESIVDDWECSRPWFVRSNNPITNQWMLPTEGLVRACLILGPDRRREAYDLGVKNFLMALDSHGGAGEFEEGVGYANMTVNSMLHAARAMAAAGDRRGIDHPFLKNFPTWLAHHLQPGGFLIGCFDAGNGCGDGDRFSALNCLSVACTGSPVSSWMLSEYTPVGPTDDLVGLAARTRSPGEALAVPPLFAAYERAAMVNWRDSWREDANGVWVRGGHKDDQHDHFDRGHVNLIFRGRPILIEASTPLYHNPLMQTHYQSCAGHNVLDLGSGKAEKNVAPLTANCLDESGGDVTVDGSACYPDVRQWLRAVRWDSDRLSVEDAVELADGEGEIIVFRWHLGTTGPAQLQDENGRFTIEWAGARMTLFGADGLDVTPEKMPDNTLSDRPWDDELGDPMHTCIVVRSLGSVRSFKLTTVVEAMD